MTLDQIKKAVAAVKAERPAYRELLDFYEKLFLAQEASKERVAPQPIKVSEELLSTKKEQGFPIIGPGDFTIDLKESEALLREICRLAVTANEALAAAGSRILDALDRSGLDARTFLSKIFSEDKAYFEEVSENIGVDEKMQVFFAYSSVRPSVLVCAQDLAAYLRTDKPWEYGYCPVCGGQPVLSVLKKEGERSLLCGFCSHQWHTKRLYCPFCGNRDHKKLHYFFSEEERAYRVDVCESCKKYLKTVDIREIQHPFYPQLEQVSTLHLDLLAQEQGLESGCPLWLPM